MRLLDRYLLRELFIPFSYCLCGFLVFWISFDLFTELATFQRLKLDAIEIAQYYAIRTPAMLVVALPIAFLLALLYALTNHSRHHELTAMRAAGVSLLRMAAPYLTVGFLLSAAVFGMNEFWVPEGLEAAEQIRTRQMSAEGDFNRKQWVLKQGFYDPRAQRQWFVEAFNLTSYEIIRPHVVWRLRDGSRREIVAERGAWVDGVWVFTNLYLLSYSTNANDLTDQQQRERLAMPEFTETPEQIKSE